MTHTVLEFKQNLFITELQLGGQGNRSAGLLETCDKIGCSKLTGRKTQEPSLYP